jgi:hypothetical protein
LNSLSLRKVSLPFDWLVSPLPSTVKVLKRLKDPNFNMQELLKEMFSIRSVHNTNNILGFNISHFALTGWDRGIGRKATLEDIQWSQDVSNENVLPFRTKITEVQRLQCQSLYKLNDEFCITSHPKVYEMFERRFNRLKDMFFTQENILIYNDMRVSCKKASKWEPSISELMLLNPLNRLIYITYPDRQLTLPLVERVEVYRVKKSMSEYAVDEPSAHCEIPSILSSIFCKI